MIAKVASKLKINIPPAHGISARIKAPDVGTSGRSALYGVGKEHNFYTRIVGVPYIVGYDTINRDIPFDGGTFSDTQLLADGRIQLTPTGITNGVGYYTTPVMDFGDQYYMESIGLDQIISYLAQITKIEIKVNDKPSGDPSWAAMSWSEYPTGLNNQGKQYAQIKLTFSSDVSNTYTPILRTINVYRDFVDNNDIFALGSEFPFADGIFTDTILNKSRHVELDIDGGDYFATGYWLSPVVDLGVGRYFKSLTWESREPEGTEIDSTPGAPKTIELRASFTSPIDLSSNPLWTDFTDWDVTDLIKKRSVAERTDLSGDDVPMIGIRVSVIDNPDNPGENVLECKGAYPELRGFDFNINPPEAHAPTRILEEFEAITDGEIQFDTKFIETDTGVVISVMEYLTDTWNKKHSQLLVKDGKIYDLPLAMFSDKVELGDILYNEWLSLRIAVDTLNNTSKLHIDKLIDDCDDPTWTEIGSALTPTIDDYRYTHGIASLRGGKDDSDAQFGYTHSVSSLNLSNGKKLVDVLVEDLTDIKDSGDACWVVFQSSSGNYYYKAYTKAELVENQIMVLGGENGDFTGTGSPDWAVINTISIWLWTNNATDEIPVGGVVVDYWRQNLLEADLEIREVTAGVNALELRAFPSTHADISESFPGTSLDSGKWEFAPVVADDELNQVYVDDGLIVDFTYRPTTSMWNFDRWGVESVFELTGDFVAEIDWEWIKSGWGNAYIPEGLSFYFGIFNNDDAHYMGKEIGQGARDMVRLLFQGMVGTETHGNNSSYRGLRLYSYQNTAAVPRSATVGEPVILQQLAHKFRLKRNYDIITFEYWDGADWINDGRELIFNDKPIKLEITSNIWNSTDLPWTVKVNSINISGPNTYDLTDTEFLVKGIQAIRQLDQDELQLDGVDAGEALLTYDSKDDRAIDTISAEFGNNIEHKIIDRGRNLNHGEFKSISGEQVRQDLFNDNDINDGWSTLVRNNASVSEGGNGVVLYTSVDDDSLARLVQNINDDFKLQADLEVELIYERPIWPITNLPDSLLYDIVVAPSTRYEVVFTTSDTDPSSGFTVEWTNKVPLAGILNTECYIGYNAGSPANLNTDGYGELIDQNDKGVPATTGNGIWLYQDTDNSYKLIINNTGSEPWMASGEIYVPGKITIDSIDKDSSPYTMLPKDEILHVHNWFNGIRLVAEFGNKGVLATINRVTDNIGNRFIVEFIGVDTQSDWGNSLPIHLDNPLDRAKVFLPVDPPIYNSSNVPIDRVGEAAGPVESYEENNAEGTTTYRKHSSNVSLVAQERIRIRYHRGIIMEQDEFNNDLSRNWVIFEYMTDGDWQEITRIETDSLQLTNFMVDCTNTKTRESLQTKLKDIKLICAGDINASLIKHTPKISAGTFVPLKVAGSGTSLLNVVSDSYRGYKRGNFIVSIEAGLSVKIIEPDGTEWTNLTLGSHEYYIPGNIRFSFSNSALALVGDIWYINATPMGQSQKFPTKKARYVRHYAWGSTLNNSTTWLHLGVFNEGTQDIAVGKPVKSNYRFRITRPSLEPFVPDSLTMARIHTTPWDGYNDVSYADPTGTTSFIDRDILWPGSLNMWNHDGSNTSAGNNTKMLKLDMKTQRTIDALSFSDGWNNTIDKNSDNPDGYYGPGDGNQTDRINIWYSNDNINWTPIAKHDRYVRYFGRRIINFNPITCQYIVVSGLDNTNNQLKFAYGRSDAHCAYMATHSIENGCRHILTNRILDWSHAWSGYLAPHDYIGKDGETHHPYVEVDLGEIIDINEVSVSMFNYDTRTYYNQKIDISEDGINWETVWIGYNPTGGGYVHDDGDVIELTKRNSGAGAIRSELLPANGWLIQVEIDDIEPQYDEEIHVISMFSTKDAGQEDIDSPMFYDNDYSLNRSNHYYGLHNDLAVAGIKLFNKYRFNYARFGGFFEVEGADGIYRVWNHVTRQWVEFKEQYRNIEQSDAADPTLGASPANPDWPAVSFLWNRNTKYFFELERTYIDEDEIPSLRRLKLDWYNGGSKSQDTFDDKFNTLMRWSERTDFGSAIHNQKYYVDRIGAGNTIAPKSSSLYGNVQDKYYIGRKIGGVLTDLEDIKNKATSKVYNADFIANQHPYKITYYEDFYGDAQALTNYPYISYWRRGTPVAVGEGGSYPFSSYFTWGDWHNLHIFKGDTSGGTGIIWTGKPIDVSKGAIVEWTTWTQSNKQVDYFGLFDVLDPYGTWMAGFKTNTDGDTGFDVYFNGSKVKDWICEGLAGATTRWRIEILPYNQGVKFYVNFEGNAYLYQTTNGTWGGGRTGTIVPNRPEHWVLVYETDQPISGAATKYFGLKKYNSTATSAYEMSIDNIIFAEFAADERTLALATGSDYDLSLMSVSLGNTYGNGYNPSYWGGVADTDVVIEPDGSDGVKFKIAGSGTPTTDDRDSYIDTDKNGNFYFNADGDFDVRTTIDVTNFPTEADIGSGDNARAELIARSWENDSEITEQDGFEFRFQVGDTYTRLYARHKINDHWSSWMHLNITHPNTIGLRIKRVDGFVTLMYRINNYRWEVFNHWRFPITRSKFALRLGTYFTTQFTTDKSATFKEFDLKGINYATTGTVLTYGIFEYEFDQVQLDQQLIFRMKDEDGKILESASYDVKDTTVLNTDAMAKDLVLVGDKTYDAFVGRMKIRNIRTIPYRYNNITILTRYNVAPDPDVGEDGDWSPWYNNAGRLVDKSDISYNTRFIQMKAVFNRSNSKLNPGLRNIGFNMDLTWHKDSEAFDEDSVWGVGGSLSWMEIEQDQDISDIGGEHSRFVQVRTTLKS